MKVQNLAQTRKHKLKALTTAGLVAGMLSGCMSQDELDALNAAFAIGDSGVNVPAPNVGPACFNERFVQPEAQITRSIDILFVMDTSGSMADNRAKVADGISGFVGQLPAEVDYQIGVMLAHGSKSSWAGKLFKHDNLRVFSSKTMDIATIQTKLKAMVLAVPSDSYGEQGEEGSYSLMKGLTTNLALNQGYGFFRADAALAVIYVADENDICAPYVDQPGLPGLTNAEKNLRSRDCAGGISTGTVVAQVKALQGERPYMFGGVVHQTLGYSDSSGNDGYGWGYMETVQATNGVSTEINDGDYTQGLANMGKLATIKLNLVVDFTLARADIDPATIAVQVDGANIEFVYDPASNDVHLSSGGGATSVIDINYCLKSEPTPEPSPTPTYTPPPS